MNPAKKDKLTKLVQKLKNPDLLESFDALDEGVANLRTALEKEVKVKTVGEVNTKLDGFRKELDFAPILRSLEELKGASGGIHKELAGNIDTKFSDIRQRLQDGLQALEETQGSTEGLSADMEALRAAQGQGEASSKRLGEGTVKLGRDFLTLDREIRRIILDIELRVIGLGKESEKKSVVLSDLQDELEKFRVELNARLASHGGGNANRNISVGGNPSVLLRYTDINLKAGANTTITYATNDVLHTTDITIAATGGGGGGIVRSIVNIAGSTTAGSASGTDYVYLCAGTLTLTLPTAVGNTNLYTVKNVGAGT